MLPTCWSHLQKAAFACYDTELHLQCPRSYRIIVDKAVFGFINASVDGRNINAACGLPRTEACHNLASLYVAYLCTGKTQCIFKVLYSHDLPSTLLAPCYAEAQLPASHPAMEVLYSCVPNQLLVPIEQTTRLGGDHVGGYLATTDYLRSIDTPQWKADLAEVFCERMKLPHVSSITVAREEDTDSAVGLFLRIRDVGRMFHSPSVSSFRGLASRTFHCPDAEPCHSDLLRIDLNTDSPDRGRGRVFRLELCPLGGDAPHLGVEEDPGRFSSTSFPVDSPTVSIGPFYNFHSMDVLTNLQLNHSFPGRGGVHHGWDKGILLEYILIYCPALPDIMGSPHVAYSFKVDREIGDTVAMATISCPLQLHLMPAILNTTTPPAQLPSELTLQCDSHLRRWSSPIPVACRTIEEISEAYRTPKPIQPPPTSTDVSLASCCTTEGPPAPPTDHQEYLTESPTSDSLIPNGSFAVVGAVAGFLLCLLLLIILLLVLRKRFLEFARHKLSEGTISTRFQQSGTLFNTLSGSLSFGRLPRSLRQHKWRSAGGGMLSQSVMTIHGSGKLVDTNNTWGNSSRRQPSYRRRSKISLPLLPHQQHSPADRNKPGARGGTPGQRRRPLGANLIIGGPSSTCSRDDLLEEGHLKRGGNATVGGHLNGAVSSPHPWALPSPGTQYDSSSDRHLLSSTGPDSLLSAGVDGSYGAGSSSQTRRQTLLSAETNLTTLSGGEDGAVILPSELPADSGFADSLPWRTVPRHNFLGGSLSTGFRRLSRFFHTVGSSVSPSAGSSVRRKARGSAATGSSRNSVQEDTLGRSSGGLHPLPCSSDRTHNATNFNGSDVTSLPRRLGIEDRSAFCLLDPTSCRLNHHQHQQPHQLSTTDFSTSMQRTLLDLSSCKSPLSRPDNSFTRQPPSDSTTLLQRTPSSTTPLVTVIAATPRHLPSDVLPPLPDVSLRPKHSEAFNAETYMEPKGGMNTERVTDYAPVAVPRMKTSVSDESDTSQQQTWPSDSSDGGEEPNGMHQASTGVIVCDPPSQTPPSFPGPFESHQATKPGENQRQQLAPLPQKSPPEDLSDEGNTWTADYFTYDESQSQRNRANWPRRSGSKLVYQPCGNNAAGGGDLSEVIRRPRLSPTEGLRSRPISDAMISNHYYDDSQLISASQINRPAGPDKRFSIISNDSLYEMVAEPTTSPRPYVDRLHGLKPIVEGNAAAPEDVQQTLKTRCRSPPPTSHVAPPYANLDDM